MNIKTAATLLCLSPISLLATGLNFQTLNPAVGDFNTSSATEISLTSSVSFGSLTGNADFATAMGLYSSFSDYNAAFTSVATGSVLEATPNNVTGSVAAGNLAGAVNLWMLVEDGLEQGVFYLGSTPALGQLDSNPAAIINGTGGAGIAIGSASGNNLVLQAVPEPSSFALLAGCFGLAWVMVRRRA